MTKIISKQNKEQNSSKDIKTNSKQDQVDNLIVHNMPRSGHNNNPLNIIRKTKSTGFSLTESSSSTKKSNVKTIGLVIIGSGLIIVSLLVYFSYRFIIKPAAKPVVQTAEKINNSNINLKNKNISIVSSSTKSTKVSATSSSNNLQTTTTILQLKTNTISSITPSLASSSNISKKESSSSSTLLATSTTNNIKQAPLIDSDHDGLNNLEELAFGTSPVSVDTDHDGYPDLVEIEHNYNPVGNGPLASDTALAIFHNSNLNYSLLYPKNWPESTVNNGQTVVFTAPNDSLFQISVQDNKQHLNISDWYHNLFSKASTSQLISKNTASWTGLGLKNSNNFYLTDKAKEHIYVISYMPVKSDRLVYPHVFQMMINSFQINSSSK